MDNWGAIEQAFKNGYEAGIEEGKKIGAYEILQECSKAFLEVVKNFDDLAEAIKDEIENKP